jgi:hypothetical protein
VLHWYLERGVLPREFHPSVPEGESHISQEQRAPSQHGYLVESRAPRSQESRPRSTLSAGAGLLTSAETEPHLASHC